MKIICVECAYIEGRLPFVVKPASALLLPHNPFFYPDFSKSIMARMGVVARVSKPGRSIDRKFAHLHYDSFSVALDICAADLLEFCIANRLPHDMAVSFDASFPIGKFVKMEELSTPFEEVSFSLIINGKENATSCVGNLGVGFDEAVAAVSQSITLREGDFVFVPLSKSCPLHIDDRVELVFDGKLSFRFNVK